MPQEYPANLKRTTNGLFLLKIDPDGDVLWIKFYDLPDSDETAYCILPLEDGGFALCGNLQSTVTNKISTMIMRFDSVGDSLWTTTLDNSFNNSGRRILSVDENLIVYTVCAQYHSTRLIWLSPEDGNVLCEMYDYPESFGSIIMDGGDMTLSSANEGFTFVTPLNVNLAHTDEAGNLLWYNEIPHNPSSISFSSSINRTMDNGYIYCGYDFCYSLDLNNSATIIYRGKAFKFDALGVEEWQDFVFECNLLHSIRQLSTGGYIACGGSNTGTGHLIRYAPETGIADDLEDSVFLEQPVPNPFSSLLTIKFNLGQSSNIELSAYTLSGTLMERIEQDLYSEGSYSVDWTPPADISSGCFLIRLTTRDGHLTRKCILLN